MPLRCSFTFAIAAVIISATSVSAQPLGTFRWQLMPHCNVMTLSVVQQGGVYILSGTDDRCGASNQQASAAGTAYVTPSGAVGIGLTSVLPGGTPVHTEVTISITTLSGRWRDSGGNSGDFVFRPGAAVPGGAPRATPPGGIPPASITNVQIASNAVTGTNVVDASLTGSDIADGAITSADIADGGINSVDIADATRSVFAGGNQFINLPAFGGTPVTVRSLTVQAPAAGKVLVNVSGFFEFSGTTQDNGRCEISLNPAVLNNDNAFYGAEGFGTTNPTLFMPFASVRGFEVPAGSTTVHLICERVAGTVAVWRTFMTAIYTAQ